MHRGDQVLIMCTVHDADKDSYTMMVSAVVYRHGVQVAEVTQYDMRLKADQ